METMSFRRTMKSIYSVIKNTNYEGLLLTCHTMAVCIKSPLIAGSLLPTITAIVGRTWALDKVAASKDQNIAPSTATAKLKLSLLHMIVNLSLFE